MADRDSGFGGCYRRPDYPGCDFVLPGLPGGRAFASDISRLANLDGSRLVTSRLCLDFVPFFENDCLVGIPMGIPWDLGFS